MSAIAGLLAQSRSAEPAHPFAILAALALAGAVARTLTSMIRALFAALVVIFSTLAFFAGIVCVLVAMLLQQSLRWAA
ncbi:MAG: hypothetical protein ABIS86_06790 [Streptosporangiaceae bacterium]